ncbi:Hypothetical protein D9617_8g049110 [Elsinoe fawcettii]|nr:Hypothetical protein D9617_8g049110 [Elsinoe fawcettii]
MGSPTQPISSKDSLTISPSDIHTYHCPCTALLFGSTTTLTSLPTRQLDSSSVLPLTSHLTTLSSASKLHHATLRSSLDEHIFDPADSTNGVAKGDKDAKLPSEMVISLEDGFEKRYLLRCSKCEAPWGYLLDWASWGEDSKSKKGRREDLVYVLEGAVDETGTWQT